MEGRAALPAMKRADGARRHQQSSLSVYLTDEVSGAEASTAASAASTAQPHDTSANGSLIIVEGHNETQRLVDVKADDERDKSKSSNDSAEPVRHGKEKRKPKGGGASQESSVAATSSGGDAEQ